MKLHLGAAPSKYDQHESNVMRRSIETMFVDTMDKTASGGFDVSIVDPVDDQLLWYEDGVWVNKHIYLNDIYDVVVPGPNDEDFLMFNDGQDEWINQRLHTDLIDVRFDNLQSGTTHTLSQLHDEQLSAGHDAGGVMVIVSSTTFDISAGSGYFTDSDTVPNDLYYVEWPEILGETALSDATTWVGLHWDGVGTSPYIIKRYSNEWNYQNEWPLGNVTAASGGVLTGLSNTPFRIREGVANLSRRIIETEKYRRAFNEGLIMGETDDTVDYRYITMTDGDLWAHINRVYCKPVNTLTDSMSDWLFFGYYHDTIGQVAAPAQRIWAASTTFDGGVTDTQDQWLWNDANDAVDPLKQIPSNRWGVFWFIISSQGFPIGGFHDAYYVNEAQAEQAPLPTHFDQFSAQLIAKYVFQQGDDTAQHIFILWGEQGIGGAEVNNHSDLAGLHADDHSQYLHLNISRVVTAQHNFTVYGTGDYLSDEWDILFGDTTVEKWGAILIGGCALALGGDALASVGSPGINLEGTVILANRGNGPQGNSEYIFGDTADEIRFGLPKSAVGLGTYNPRSMIIAGPAVFDDQIYEGSYWGFDNLAMDTSGSGADLGVQHDVEILGKLWVDNIASSTAGTITFDEAITTQTLHVIDTTDVELHLQATGVDSTAWLALENDAREYRLRITGANAFDIYDVTAGSTRLTMDTAGDFTFAQDVDMQALSATTGLFSGQVSVTNTSTGMDSDGTSLYLKATANTYLNTANSAYVTNTGGLVAVSASFSSNVIVGGGFQPTANIYQTTSDGSDTGAIGMCGGGSLSTSRGGYIIVYGNEHANAGQVTLRPGTAATGANEIFLDGTVTTDALTATTGTFTDDVDVTGDFLVTGGTITSNERSATQGMEMLGGTYTGGHLPTFGSVYSSGGPMMGYAVWSSHTTTHAFISSSSANLGRGALYFHGGQLRCYTGAGQIVAVGDPVSMSQVFAVNTTNFSLYTPLQMYYQKISWANDTANYYMSKTNDAVPFTIHMYYGVRLEGDAGSFEIDNNGSVVIEGDTTSLFSTGNPTGMKFSVNDSAEASSRINHYESANYGFSWVYAGAANPTLDGTTFTLDANEYNLIRHDNSATGSVVLNVKRTEDTVRFAGPIVVGDLNYAIAGMSNNDIAAVNGILAMAVNGASNIDHLYHNDGTNTWHFCSDTTRMATGNSGMQCGWVVVGSPTGGAQGAGSINAQALYVNGVAVSTGSDVSGSGTTSKIAKWTSSSAIGDSRITDSGSGAIVLGSGEIDVGFASSISQIAPPTSDGSDNSEVYYCGGGGAGSARGGSIRICGNERSGVEGLIDVVAGNDSAVGDIVFRTASSAERMRIHYGGGITVGVTPTPTQQGAGTINVTGDIYKNDTAYTNPDYVFEHYYGCKTDEPEYDGLAALPKVEKYIMEHLHLPRITRAQMGIFQRADTLLEKVEELFLYTIEQEKKITALEELINATSKE